MKLNSIKRPSIFIGIMLVVAAALLVLPIQVWAAAPDSDGDGIADNKDLCPTEGGIVDAAGCPLDSDADGVVDNNDQCPLIPAAIPDESGVGCPDADLDGFFANLDCNDDDPLINPGADELCGADGTGDGIDNNCADGIDEICVAPSDTDGDGLSDELEQAGVVLRSDLTLVSRDPGSDASEAFCKDGTSGDCYYLPRCPPDTPLSSNDPARSLCVDPASKDVFVITQRAQGCSDDPACEPMYDFDGDWNGDSNLPLSGISSPAFFDLYATITAPQGSKNDGGLGIAVHELIQDTSRSTDQHIAENTYAVRVVESLATDTGRLGLHTLGNPLLNSTVTIWTERIKRWLFFACTEIELPDPDGPTRVDQCLDTIKGDYVSTPSSLLLASSITNADYANSTYQDVYYSLYRNYIQDILSHELGHAVDLAVGSQIHWPAGEGVVMEQTISVDATKRKNLTYAQIALGISTGYHLEDKLNFDLK